MTRKHHCGHCSLAGHYARDCHIKAEGRQRPDKADKLACEALRGKRANGDTRAAVARLIRDLFADRLARAKEAVDDVCDEGNMDRCQWIDVAVLDRELRALFDLEEPTQHYCATCRTPVDVDPGLGFVPKYCSLRCRDRKERAS